MNDSAPEAPVQTQSWDLKIGKPNGTFYIFNTLGDKEEATRVAKLFLVALQETTDAIVSVMVSGDEEHFVVEPEKS